MKVFLVKKFFNNYKKPFWWFGLGSFFCFVLFFFFKSNIMVNIYFFFEILTMCLCFCNNNNNKNNNFFSKINFQKIFFLCKRKSINQIKVIRKNGCTKKN